MSVTPAELTGTERAVLLVLMAQCRPVPNPELGEFGPKLDKPSREKLNQLGLIESERSGGRIVHELTDRGWRLCRDIAGAGAPPRAVGPAKTLYTVLAALDRYLDGNDLSLADVFAAGPPAQHGPEPEPESVRERINAVYRELAPQPGGWVGLARLRDHLADVPRAEVDAALHELYRTPAVSLIPEENQKVLTPADRAAAIEIGDQAKHLIAIEA